KGVRKETKTTHKKKSSYQPIVPAVEQASRILLCLSKNSNFKMGLTEISREVGIHKSKGFSILNTLNQFGFVEKDLQTKTYSLGPGLLSLSRHVLDNIRYPEVVAPFLQRLAVETNGTAIFGLINGEHVIVVGKHEGNQNIGFTVRLGHRFHITLGAHGKSILAFMPETEREKILSRKKVFFYLDPSRVDREFLKEELARCRALGYSQDIGNITPGANVVSAPLFAHRDKMIGCLILIGTFPENKIPEYGPKVAGIARQISQKLGADAETIYPKRLGT
ncbi:MAG: IclR family transcriptional regulator, partial [Deltaproteobacteria bacterium]|nr:IclR family transcriptional regulator [Deltaproteobacteria bacterium]